MLAFPKSSDPVFFSLSILCLFFFFFELIVCCVAKQEYLLGFYFWLDLVAALSLIPDVGWIWDPLTGQDESSTSSSQEQLQNAGKASRAGTRAGRVIRIIRVIRLIRIVKLYKNAQIQMQQKQKKQQELFLQQQQFQQEDDSFDNQDEQQQSKEKEPLTDEQKDLQALAAPVEFEFPQEMKVSKKLSDLTTRKVIMIVLCLLFLLPIFEVDLYYMPKSSFDHCVNSLCAFDENILMFNTVWDECISAHPNDDDYMWPIVYLFDGVSERMFQDTDPNDLRSVEKQYANCDEVVGIFDIRSDSRLAAQLGIWRTIFVCIVLSTAAIVFTNDTNKLVLVPIERMLERVKRIAKNPLAAMEENKDEADILELENKKDEEEEGKFQQLAKTPCCMACCPCFAKKDEDTENYETAVLENTIVKISILLALGFGEAGATVIAKNIDQTVGGGIDPMVPGQKIMAVFGFCDIRNFTDTTEVLLEEVMVFVNEIADVVHGIVNKYSGAANKNIGDAFLLVWKIKDSEYYVEDNELRLRQTRTVQDTVDCALISFIKIISKINKDPVLLKYSKHEKLAKRMAGYKVKMGFGLHQGWAIEGAIGSAYKIDASYLSPHVNMSSRLEAATKQYGVPLLCSGGLISTLSPEIRKYTREIDTVTVKGSKQPMELFTVDLDITKLKPAKRRRNFNSKQHYQEGRRKINQMLENNVRTVVFLRESNSFRKMRKYVSLQFETVWENGYKAYKKGDWVNAKQMCEETLRLVPSDGPSKTLLDFMSEHKFLAPLSWAGFRELTEK